MSSSPASPVITVQTEKTAAPTDRKKWISRVIFWVAVIVLLSFLFKLLSGSACQSVAARNGAGCKILNALGSVAGAITWVLQNVWTALLAGLAAVLAFVGAKALPAVLDPKHFGTEEQKAEIAAEEARREAEEAERRAEDAEWRREHGRER